MHGFLLQKRRQSYSSDTFATQQQKEMGGEHHAPGNLPTWKFQNPLCRRQNGPPLTQN